MDPKDFIRKQIKDLEDKRVGLQEELDATQNAFAKSDGDLLGAKARLKALSDQAVVVKSEVDLLHKAHETNVKSYSRWSAELTVLDIQLEALKAYLKG